MGHESLAGLSPAHRRTQTPTSPSATVFRRQAREDIDLSWMALIRRHQFLLFMLVILAFLCSVYLYFAITLGGGKCSGLSGTQKALCHVKNLKDGGPHGHRVTRGLLGIQDSLRFPSIEECSHEYSDYSPCMLEHAASRPCRKLGERPPHCRIPALLKFDKPLLNVSVKPVSESYAAAQRTIQLGTEADSNYILTVNATRSNDTKGILDLAASLHSLSSTGQAFRALIIGCKGGEWAEELIHRNFLTISVAGMGIDDCSVEMLLERGLPALQLDFAHQKVPYLANSFDLVLCDDCDVPWHESNGKHLLEIERLLRPQGYFLWVYQLLSQTSHSNQQLMRLMKINSWVCLSRAGSVSLWQTQKSWPGEIPSANTKLKDNPSGFTSFSIWLQQVMSDRIKWRKRIAEYKSLLETSLFKKVQNVLDMNAGIGSFASCLTKDIPVWVMNVVPHCCCTTSLAPDNRVLPAFQHDWCDAFPSPPRAYDMVHASGLSEFEKNRCGMLDVLLEVDRLLRPGGLLIVHDSPQIMERVKILAKLLNWEKHSEGDRDHFGTTVVFFK